MKVNIGSDDENDFLYEQTTGEKENAAAAGSNYDSTKTKPKRSIAKIVTISSIIAATTIGGILGIANYKNIKNAVSSHFSTNDYTITYSPYTAKNTTNDTGALVSEIEYFQKNDARFKRGLINLPFSSKLCDEYIKFFGEDGAIYLLDVQELKQDSAKLESILKDSLGGIDDQDPWQGKAKTELVFRNGTSKDRYQKVQDLKQRITEMSYFIGNYNTLATSYPEIKDYFFYKNEIMSDGYQFSSEFLGRVLSVIDKTKKKIDEEKTEELNGYKSFLNIVKKRVEKIRQVQEIKGLADNKKYNEAMDKIASLDLSDDFFDYDVLEKANGILTQMQHSYFTKLDKGKLRGAKNNVQNLYNYKGHMKIPWKIIGISLGSLAAVAALGFGGYAGIKYRNNLFEGIKNIGRRKKKPFQNGPAQNFSDLQSESEEGLTKPNGATNIEDLFESLGAQGTGMPLQGLKLDEEQTATGSPANSQAKTAAPKKAGTGKKKRTSKSKKSGIGTALDQIHTGEQPNDEHTAKTGDQ